MSTFDEYQYFQFQQQQQQQFAFNNPHAFSLQQHGGTREKTPTDSLINHPGLSPRPLTATPPPHSRRSSRPTEQLPRDQQFPDQMVYDDGSSNSPTSVGTPDGESFEVEMLEPDMQAFYHQDTANMSTQVSNNAVPAADHSMIFTSQGTFTDHGMLFQQLLLTRADTGSRSSCFSTDNDGPKPTISSTSVSYSATAYDPLPRTGSAQCFRAKLHNSASSA
jgi:hypothetical protein